MRDALVVVLRALACRAPAAVTRISDALVRTAVRQASALLV
jgi:hypothetical protein